VQVGHRIFIEDGLLKFLCTEKNYNELRCNCTVGGVLKTSKGINLPDTSVNVAAITDRDWECADWAIENDLDYLALSFVRKPDDIVLLRQHLTNRSSDIQLIAKIEKGEALQHIDGIIEASDGLMVARGDLGVELDLARVPIIQKDLIRRCQTAGKPVIVATQMLQSMIELASPTRAEVSDVANAIFDGTDALMLSGETSVGKFPIGAVLVMSRVAEVTEEYQIANPSVLDLRMQLKTMALSAAVAKGVRQMVTELKATLVVVWSQTGATARIFSKTRFPVPIIALSTDHRALRRMSLHFGVIPQETSNPDDPREFVRMVDDLVREQKFARGGDPHHHRRRLFAWHAGHAERRDDPHGRAGSRGAPLTRGGGDGRHGGFDVMRQMVASSLLCVCFFAPATLVGCASPPEKAHADDVRTARHGRRHERAGDAGHHTSVDASRERARHGAHYGSDDDDCSLQRAVYRQRPPAVLAAQAGDRDD
jgi:pyruvate kinase